MTKLILTENDLSRITNALNSMASLNRRTAENCGDSGEGQYLKLAATQSADSYQELADKIESAESIVVEI